MSRPVPEDAVCCACGAPARHRNYLDQLFCDPCSAPDAPPPPMEGPGWQAEYARRFDAVSARFGNRDGWLRGMDGRRTA